LQGELVYRIQRDPRLSMNLVDLSGRVAALIGGAALAWRQLGGVVGEQAVGSTPAIPAAKPQGSLPTLKMPTARGWAQGHTPIAAAGLKVNALASGLRHPRWLHVLPNGDVLVAEALQEQGALKTVFDYAMVGTMKRAAAVGISPNRITRLRDADADGVAEIREVFLDGLNQPFGMALLCDTFYVGNTDGLVAFPFAADTNRIAGPGRKITSFKPGGHWTRSVLPSPDGRKLYVGVGSLSNIADSGMSAERAARRSTRLISKAARAASLPVDCVILWAWPGSLRPKPFGQSSTSATAWGTRRPPTT
jgi:glucose/arabinose dehydrogenase